MLLKYFGFREDPFGSTPDPRWLYQSPTHREALASLKYSFKSNRGFTALIAAPGMGKTTLLFRFLEDLRKSARTVFLFDTQCEPRELISYILRDLDITPAESSVEKHEQLNDALLEEARAGRRFVTVIDEAQNLSDAALETVRLLTNFETPRAKLMQVVLAGQPKLSDNLMKPSLVQLRQRISTICRLDPLSADEASAYINHRIKLAGYVGEPLFTEDAISHITAASQGIPRTINNLCFNSLSLCCALKNKQVDARMVSEVVADQELSPQSKETSAINPEIVAGPTVESEEPDRSISQAKFWVIAAAVLLVASLLGILAFSKISPFRSQAEAEARSLNVKAAASTRAVQAATLPNSTRPAQPAPQPTSFQIEVGPNQRLRDIAVENLGDFNQELLHQIQALNPKLNDPDHIEAGQRLWLPGLPAAKGADALTPNARRETKVAPVLVSTGKPIGSEASSNAAPFEVIVGPNQTLQDLSVKYLGDFDLKRLHQIRALNPKLIDPDHILLGQKIRLPGPPAAPVVADTTPTTSLRRVP